MLCNEVQHLLQKLGVSCWGTADLRNNECIEVCWRITPKVERFCWIINTEPKNGCFYFPTLFQNQGGYSSVILTMRSSSKSSETSLGLGKKNPPKT